MGWYGRMEDIKGTICLIWLGIHCISIIPPLMGSCACWIRAGKINPTPNSLTFQFLIIISLFSSYPFLSHPQCYHHMRTPCLFIFLVSPFYDHELTLITESTQDWLCPTCSQSNLLEYHCSIVSTFPHVRGNQWIQSELKLRPPSYLPPPDWPSLCKPPIELNHCIQTESPNALHCSLKVHHTVYMISGSMCITQHACLHHPSASLHLLNCGLQVHLTINSVWGSMYICKPSWFRHPGACPGSRDL